jgi:hypothetical protein
MVKRKIYPTNIKKYVNCTIRQKPDDSFTAKIYKKTSKETIFYERNKFKTYEKALRFVRRKSKKHGLLIKNMIYDRGTHYECKLTKGQVMKFDPDDLDKVNLHTLYTHKNRDMYYAFTSFKANGKKKVNFGNIILNHDTSKSKLTVDHMYRDGLDNRKRNLRLINQSEQNINQRTQKNNTSGIKGVSFKKRRNHWCAVWSIGLNKTTSKCFSCNTYGDAAEQMAIDYYNRMITQSEYYSVLRM